MVEEVAVAYACKQLANNESPKCRVFESKLTTQFITIFSTHSSVI